MTVQHLRKVAGILFGLAVLLLPAIADAQQPTQAQANAIRQSCRSDYQSYCSSVPTGGSASLQCLQSHLNQLSSSCQTAVSSATGGGGSSPSAAAQSAPPPQAAPPMAPREKMAMMRRSCGGDFRAFCRGVPLGGGDAIRCLEANQARLSPSCRAVMAQAGGGR
jgi:Cysteine rich repeat